MRALSRPTLFSKNRTDRRRQLMLKERKSSKTLKMAPGRPAGGRKCFQGRPREAQRAPGGPPAPPATLRFGLACHLRSRRRRCNLAADPDVRPAAGLVAGHCTTTTILRNNALCFLGFAHFALLI